MACFWFLDLAKDVEIADAVAIESEPIKLFKVIMKILIQELCF